MVSLSVAVLQTTAAVCNLLNGALLILETQRLSPGSHTVCYIEPVTESLLQIACHRERFTKILSQTACHTDSLPLRACH